MPDQKARLYPVDGTKFNIRYEDLAQTIHVQVQFKRSRIDPFFKILYCDMLISFKKIVMMGSLL